MEELGNAKAGGIGGFLVFYMSYFALHLQEDNKGNGKC